MSALTNKRQEAFCQAFVKGEHAGNAVACYAAVYKKDKNKTGTRASASKLNRKANICKRIAELSERAERIENKATERAIERLAISKESVLAELAKIGFSNMLDYIRVIEGEAVVDLSALDRDKAAAIAEVVVETYMEGRGHEAERVKKIRFKLGDKRAALVDIGKHLGMFVDRVQVSEAQYAISDEPMTPEEWRKEFTRPN